MPIRQAQGKQNLTKRLTGWGVVGPRTRAALKALLSKAGTVITELPYTPKTSSPVSAPVPRTFRIGATIKTSSEVNVRALPVIDAKNILCVQPSGTVGTIVSGPANASGYTWWSMDYARGCDGWSIKQSLLLH
ncbi:hypothetical protein A2853_00175 [Candidatus Kaiserbacteria bacterium RIFCSPHIGHO2_01_FULL_55_17]|uniref:SH3b domain-containing protein n=1 Tax=Candidatus Kaiserbacteria bacterium RIFCSPHIGHO2_01_FULL_55_17 TaxID=1798484 RepID=A0A1F6DA60_9BACT|nr:MAG: hypothetical protein A2853_00175 [Candidatus Kaiserbacteria bacterium RIFCSPHIGHO2_01_FULL_55_17]